MEKSPHVTSTAIAVALAVIVVVGILFFGKQIIASVAVNQVPIATTTQDQTSAGANNATDNSNTMDDTSTSSPLAGIPADVTQLMMKDDVVGTGAEATPGDTVTVQYVGMLTNGTVFDASANHGTAGFTFTLGAGQVIKGWDKGVEGMKVGGKRELVIPASLGYGSQAVGPIPANSTLVFEVELQNVQPAAQ